MKTLRLVNINYIEAEEQIQEIMTNLDFKEVRKVMKLLNWKWGINIDPDIQDANGVPKVAHLKATTKDYLIECINCLDKAITAKPHRKYHEYQIGTGGFYWVAMWYKKADPDSERRLYLDVKFATTTWDTAE